MPENFLPEKQVQGNSLELHLRTFATSLLESGYRKKTIQEKLYLLAEFGWWFGKSRRPVSQIDELLVEAFIKHRRRVRLGGLKTLQQFLDHLRKHDVFPDREHRAQPTLHISPTEKRLSPRTASRRCHGSSSPWRGPRRDRALAGARIPRNNTDLSACRHAFEGEGTLAH